MGRMTSRIEYLGGLRTKATHEKSGETFITDAPPDNNGKGEAFSPTDLVATALGTCMVTIMGIRSAKMGFDLPEVKINIVKIMGNNPRKIGEVQVELKIPMKLDVKEKTILEKAGLNCPVALSLHPNLVQNVKFNWIEG